MNLPVPFSSAKEEKRGRLLPISIPTQTMRKDGRKGREKEDQKREGPRHHYHSHAACGGAPRKKKSMGEKKRKKRELLSSVLIGKIRRRKKKEGEKSCGFFNFSCGVTSENEERGEGKEGGREGKSLPLHPRKKRGKRRWLTLFP